METVKLLALASAVAFPLSGLLAWFGVYLVRTQYKWRKLPPPPAAQTVAPWPIATKASK